MFSGPSATGPNPDDTVRACPQHPPLLQAVPGTSGESVPQLNSYLANPDILRVGGKGTTAFPGAKPCCFHELEDPAWNLKKKKTNKQENKPKLKRCHISASVALPHAEMILGMSRAPFFLGG